MTAPPLPSTAVCPGCDAVVVLPIEPREEPLICATCGSEVPDGRLELIAAAAEAEAAAAAVAALPPEHRIYTRKSLLKGFRDLAADRAIDAVRDIGARAKF